jgi:hypothetical protein
MIHRNIVANRIRTPDGTVLHSRHHHDYVTYTDNNGLEYMVDGGLEYLRRTIHEDDPYTEISVFEDDPFDLIRRAFAWGTRGKDGKQPLRWKLLADLDDDHIEAILETQSLRPMMLKLFKLEQQWRIDHATE